MITIALGVRQAGTVLGQAIDHVELTDQCSKLAVFVSAVSGQHRFDGQNRDGQQRDDGAVPWGVAAAEVCHRVIPRGVNGTMLKQVGGDLPL